MMNYYSTLVIFIFLLFSNGVSAQGSPAEIIQKSMDFHDPQGLLKDSKIELSLLETRPNGSDRNSKVVLHGSKEYCKINRNVDGNKIEMKIRKNRTKIKFNGKRKISEENIEKYRLTPDRAVSMKNYYRYLWLLPSVLKDPGSILDPEYGVDDFFGKTCIELKVTYSPEIGNDIWYFYFNLDTYALEGYRFYHDEAANDGEYILLSELTTFETVRLPKVRKWYTHKEGKFLGADHLTQLTLK